MPDIPNRADFERLLAQILSRLGSKHRRELLTLLGDPPSFGNVPTGFWEKINNETANAVYPVLNDIYNEAAERMVDSLPIGVDWGIINERAAAWARQYAFELIKGMNETTIRALQAALNSFFQNGMTREQLEAQLVRLFGPVRAEMIAITEVTRAAVAGERAIAAELAKDGIDMVPYWLTRNDELVCPICGPRNNKPITDGVFPPAHPRCRCGTRFELPKVKR